MKANFRHTCSIIAIASTAAALARAGETPIDISALANEPWSFVGPAQITGGTSYPQEARISAAFHSRFRLVRRIIGMPAPQQTSDRAPSASPIQVWTDGEGQRLDRQEYILPGAFASQVACAAYAVESSAISSSKIFYDQHLGQNFQDVALSNTGAAAVKGPLFFILEDLPSALNLVNESAATACFTPIGSP
jgi:hypothetical protein